MSPLPIVSSPEKSLAACASNPNIHSSLIFDLWPWFRLGR
jgi:hypothetical protein